MAMVWKDIIIENHRILAVKDKDYAFNRTFFNKNLFVWRLLDSVVTIVCSASFSFLLVK